MASLFELLDLTSADAILKSIGRPTLPKSSVPEYMHLLANWAMFDEGRIYVSDGSSQVSDFEQLPPESPNSKVPVRFGTVEMYPEPFRKAQDSAYVQIGEFYNEKNTHTTFCYAIEIILNQKRADNSPTGKFLGFEGWGAFTMSYNSRIKTTAVYSAELGAKKPTLYYSVRTNQDGTKEIKNTQVDLFANLQREGESSNDWRLQVFIRGFDGTQEIKFLVHSQLIKDVKIEDFNNSTSKKGMYGLISDAKDTVTSSYYMTDIQFIPSTQERRDTSGLSSAAIGLARKPYTREDNINTYAFDWSQMDDVSRDDTPPARDPAESTNYNYVVNNKKTSGNVAQKSSTKVPVSIPVFIDIETKLNFKAGTPTGKRGVYEFGYYYVPDNTGLFALVLKGGKGWIYFPGEGDHAFSLSTRIYFTIDWVYEKSIFTTPQLGNTGVQKITSATGLRGTTKGAQSSLYYTYLNNSNKVGIDRDPSPYQQLADELSQKFSVDSTTYQDCKNRPNKCYTKYASAEDHAKFIDGIVTSTKSAVDNMRIWVNYALFKPQFDPEGVKNNDKFWEYLYVQGRDTNIKNEGNNSTRTGGDAVSVDLTDLANRDKIKKFLDKGVKGKAPIMMFCRSSESKDNVLTPWNFSDFNSYKIYKNSNIQVLSESQTKDLFLSKSDSTTS